MNKMIRNADGSAGIRQMATFTIKQDDYEVVKPEQLPAVQEKVLG